MIDALWEQVFCMDEWGKYPPEHVVRFASKLPRGAKVLDVGSGPGANTWFLCREGFSVSAIDGSPTAINMLNRRLRAEGLRADARVGDFTSGLPWEDQSFDAVLDNAAIYANPLHHAIFAITEVARVLRPDGVFLSAAFSQGTTGYQSGEQVSQCGWKNITQGPLAGKGFSLVLDRQTHDVLYGHFHSTRTEKVSWTRDGETIELWLTECSGARLDSSGSVAGSIPAASTSNEAIYGAGLCP